jgi:hypothetical protein
MLTDSSSLSSRSDDLSDLNYRAHLRVRLFFGCSSAPASLHSLPERSHPSHCLPEAPCLLERRSPTMRHVAPPPHAGRFQALFPRGATFNIVGPNHPTDGDLRMSNKIENGTSAAQGLGGRVVPFSPFPSSSLSSSLNVETWLWFSSCRECRQNSPPSPLPVISTERRMSERRDPFDVQRSLRAGSRSGPKNSLSAQASQRSLRFGPKGLRSR